MNSVYMKEINLFSILFFVAVTLFAQKGNNKEQVADTMELNKEYTTTLGLKYKLIKKGYGIKAYIGDYVTIDYIGKLNDGSEIYSSRDLGGQKGQPLKFVLGVEKQQVRKEWIECISHLYVGDVVILLPVPLDSVIDLTSEPWKTWKSLHPANLTVTYEIKLVDVKAAPTPWDVKGQKIDSTADGLKYIVVKKGTGAKSESGTKRVSIHNSGYLGDGTWKLIYSSLQSGQPIEFGLGSGKVIKGLDEGVALMHVGDKMRLIIPYQLAYGEAGMPPDIPAKSTVIFDVELKRANVRLPKPHENW